MKSRAREEGVAVDERFIEFADFLETMGTKPHPQHTLDRHPNQEGPYTLENVRWADKVTQANNRRNTRHVLHMGKMLPATEVARLTGEKPDTLRKRAARSNARRKPAWPIDAQQSRDAELAAIASRRLDPFRWVHPDETVVRFWVGLYHSGEEEWYGTVPIARRIRSPVDGILRDETFVEFMMRMDTQIVSALTTGDLTELPDAVANLLASSTYDRERQREVSTTRLIASHQAWLATQFANDPLVDDKTSYSCDVSWLEEVRAKQDNGLLARAAQNRFLSAKVQLPTRLKQLLADLPRVLLGRKNSGL